MRKFRCVTLAAVGTAFMIGAARHALAQSGEKPLHLRVIATHDFHGALAPVAYPWSHGRLVGGAPALAATIDSARARCHCPTLFVDAGDEMQGTLESNLVYGQSDIRAFNLMKLDAAAVGNHELDWGVDTLIAREHESKYPWLAANVFLRGTHNRPAWATPDTIVERDGIRVGIIGYLTVETPTTQPAKITARLDFVRGLPGIRGTLDRVRARHPDFIIVTAHAGGGCDGGRCRGEMVDLARALDSAGVDLIVGGHDHTATADVVHGIPIVRASSSGRAIGVVDLERTRSGAHRFTIERDTVWDDRVTPSAAMIAALQPYVAFTDSIRRQQITHFAHSILETDLGPSVAAAMRIAAHADIGSMNRGGVRSDLNAGLVTYGDVFRVLPFSNLIVRVTIPGRQLRAVLDSIVGLQSEYFSGLRVEYDSTARAGRRIRSISLENGQPVPADTMLTVAFPDFVIDSPPGVTVLAPFKKERLDITLRDSFVAYLKRGPL